MRHDARDMRGSAGRRLCAPAALAAGRFTLAALLVAASAAITKETLHSAPRDAQTAEATAPPTVAMTNVALRQPTERSQSAATGAAPGTDAEPALDVRYFDGRPVRRARALRMRVTAYSPDAQSCGKWADGYTASGKSVWTNAGKLVAADTSLLPLGSLVSVPGYDGGAIVPVLDRGGAIKGARLDVLYPTHERALEWGVQELDVAIWEYADDEDAP